jgi:hypothetical protein
VGTLQQETTEDADGSTPLGKPAAPNQQEDGVSVSATELTTPSPTAAKTERKGLETIQPVDFEQIVLALSNTPGALDVLAKEIFKQSGSPHQPVTLMMVELMIIQCFLVLRIN